MGVAPVDGYGPITKSNAAEIYKDKETYNNLSVAQKHLVDKYVPQEERDQIDYDTGADHDNAFKEGRDKIGDAKNADEHGGQAGNAIATGGGAVACAAGAVALLKAPIYSNVCGAMWGAIGMAVLSALSLVCVNKYDNGYDDRTKANDNADGTNETIDNTTTALEETMDLMDEDMDLYQGQQEDMTNMVNNNVSAKADLQAQLVDAQAAGDVNRVKQLKEQIKAIDETDFSKQQDEIDETREHLEEYRLCNDEALGVKDGGETVSDFLKEGTPLGIGGAVVATLLGIATIICGIDAAKAAASFKTIWEVPMAVVACAMLMVSASLLGKATNTMKNKTVKEFECGSSGRDMEGHVSTLNDMITQQEGYVESTGENFDETDKGAKESRSNAEESAAETVGKAKDRVAVGGGKKDDDDDDDKDKDKDKK